MNNDDILFWFGAGLAIIVILICLQIEILNKAAGHYLPRKADGKWRQSPFTSEEMWRKYQWYATGDETVLERPLTKNERIQMQKDISLARARNVLRDVLDTFGLLQYILAPTALILSIIAIITKRHIFKKILCTLFIISNFIAINLMFTRGYFTSLGW